MATCAPSARSALRALAASLLVAALFPATAETARSGCCTKPAKPRVQEEPLERLKSARAKLPAATPSRIPSVPRAPSERQRRQAFEALRDRTKTPELEARARDALARSRQAMAAGQAAMSQRIGRAIGLDVPNLVETTKLTPAVPHGWVPVLFVSSSMPVAMLRTYASQLERARGVLAFRGMPGGLSKVAPMAKLSAEILRLDPGCEGPACAMREVQLIVDPLLFRQHGVDRVPALAMVPGDPTRPYFERDDASPRASHVVLGDAALTGLLEEYGRLGGKEEVRNVTALVGSR